MIEDKNLQSKNDLNVFKSQILTFLAFLNGNFSGKKLLKLSEILTSPSNSEQLVYCTVKFIKRLKNSSEILLLS